MDLLVIPIPFIASLLVSMKCPTYSDTGNNVRATPPGYVFGIVWSILYLAIGFAWYLIRKNDPNTFLGIKISDILFIINLIAINGWLFYYNCDKNKKAALYTFLIAIATVIMLIIYSCLYTSGSWWVYMLLVPYLVWLLFAQQLNFHSLEKDNM